MRNPANTKAFTLIELLVAMVVTSIVLTAVTTLAFALGAANDSTDDMIQKQAQIRLTTLRIQELIKYCNLICFVNEECIVIWLADDNSNGKININELVIIDTGQNTDYLQVCTFHFDNDIEIELGSIETVSSNWRSKYSDYIQYLQLLPECSDVDFKFDLLPPYSQFVSISFNITENNNIHHYQINTALRNQAGNLLDEFGNIERDDD